MPDICGFLESIIIRNGSCWALCALESPCFARKETHPDDIKARGIRSSRTPFRPTWIRSLFRARSRNRLISGRLIPLPCARMTCKEWNPQEHLGPAPWQRIAISAWSASFWSFCARDRKRQVAERRNRPQATKRRGSQGTRTISIYAVTSSGQRLMTDLCSCKNIIHFNNVVVEE